MSSKFIQISIAAIPMLRKSNLSPEDRHVEGVYSVMLPADFPPARLASAALDAFHSTVPVDELEDFEFVVIHPETGEVLEQGDDAPYSNTDAGHDFMRLSDVVPRGYEAVFESKAARSAGTPPDSIRLAANDAKAARKAALARHQARNPGLADAVTVKIRRIF